MQAFRIIPRIKSLSSGDVLFLDAEPKIKSIVEDDQYGTGVVQSVFFDERWKLRILWDKSLTHKHQMVFGFVIANNEGQSNDEREF